MKPPLLATLTIKTLRRDLQERRFAVPKLQRNFVWDGRRAAVLLDSIYRNIPIGSLFLWRIERSAARLIRQSANVLPAFNDRNRDIWFVIDGQQRLSVIHQAFEGEQKQNDRGQSIDFGRLCFVVKPEAEQEDPQRIIYRKPHGRDFVPLKDILAPDWLTRMPTRAQRFLKSVRNCRDQILNYPLPVVTIQKASLAEIGEVFIRVNSQGMKITSADRAVASMGKVDMRAMAEAVRQRMREDGLALTAIDPILMGFNLIAELPAEDGDPPKLETMARKWSKRILANQNEELRFGRLWDKYHRAFLSAVDYMRRTFPVHDESYLPSENMLATLSVFFYHHRSPPDRWQASQIRKWFWATGVAERYSGRGYHRNLVADAKLFAALGSGKKRSFQFSDLLDPVVDIQQAEYGARSARTRAFLCLLAAQEPRYLENGEPIYLRTVSSESNRRHRHHVFPQAQMNRVRQKARVYNGLWNICLLVSQDNLSIGKRVPRTYLAGYRDASRKRFARVMKSHLIPAGPESGVWERGIVSAFKRFREVRLRLICKAFEDQATMRLFAKL